MLEALYVTVDCCKVEEPPGGQASEFTLVKQ